jgi:hypothetical protein
VFLVVVRSLTSQPTKVEHKGNSKNTKDKVFIQWFDSPQRLAYFHIVEEATKAWVSPNPILFSRQERASLKIESSY